MDSHIAVFPEGSHQYKRLEQMVTILKNLYPKRKFSIEVTWFDAGQDWLWTTIIANDCGKYPMDYQLMTPRQQKEVLDQSRDLADIAKEFRR